MGEKEPGAQLSATTLVEERPIDDANDANVAADSRPPSEKSSAQTVIEVKSGLDDDEENEKDGGRTGTPDDTKSIASAAEGETYPEGGIQAWLVVLGCWLALFSSLGLMNVLATFQTYVATHQLANYDAGTIGWIFSLYVFLAFFLGIYIGPIFDKYGPRWLIASGSVLLVLSLMLLSISFGASLHISPRPFLSFLFAVRCSSRVELTFRLARILALSACLWCS